MGMGKVGQDIPGLNSLLHILRDNSWQAWDGSQDIDLTADIEITGTPVINRGYTVSSSGANSIVTVSSAQRLKIYKAILSTSQDINGEVYLQLGSKKIASVQYPKQGGQYVMISSFPDYEYGDLDEDLTLYLPTAVTVSLNLSYEVI